MTSRDQLVSGQFIPSEFTPRRIKPRVNAFFDKLFQHPDRVFPGLNFEEDVRAFQEKLSMERFSEGSPYTRLLVEFGSGSGGHLLELARMKPDTLCVGFEIRFKRAVRTIEKAKKENLPNVLVFRGRGELVAEVLGIINPQQPNTFSTTKTGVVDELYVNFPDPWEKERQKKHRILSKRLFSIAAQVMRSGGIVSVKTDHSEYFESFLEEMNIKKDATDIYNEISVQDSSFSVEAVSWNLDELSDDYKKAPAEAKLRSEFENLFRHQGLPVHYARFRHHQSTRGAAVNF